MTHDRQQLIQGHKGGDGAPEQVSVRLAQLGKGVFRLTMDAGSSVAKAALQAGVNLLGFDVRVNGRSVVTNHVLVDGDLVTLVPLIKGGRVSQSIHSAVVSVNSHRWRWVMRPTVMRVVSIIAVLSFWQIVGSMLPPIFISTPSMVAVALVTMVGNGQLWDAARESLTNLAIGFSLGSTAGIAVGFAMGLNRVTASVLDPYLTVTYAMPKIILIPLVIVWFGLGAKAKIALIFVSCMLPAVIPTYQAIRYTNQRLLEVARAFNLTPAQQIWKIVLPGTIPYIVTSLRLAVGSGVITMVNAELYLRLSGLGGLLTRFGSRFDTAGTMGVLVVLSIIGLSLVEILKVLERRISPWRKASV